MDDRTRWPDLPPDLVREISGRIQAAADLVRFHAVCKPWRDSRRFNPPLSRTTTTQPLLPWLIAPPPADIKEYPLRFRCVFSKSSYRAPPSPAPVSGPRMKNWVAAVDGTAVRYLTVERLGPILNDPLAAATHNHHLPLFPEYDERGGNPWPWDEDQDPRGIVYGDGTVLLYGISPHVTGDKAVRFTAALLRPADGARWTIVRRTLPTSTWHSQFCFCAAYHGGKILVTVNARQQWRSVVVSSTPEDEDVLVPSPWTGTYYQYHPFSCQHSYALESRGELLWALVHVQVECSFRKGELREHRVSVSVYALEEESPAPEKKKKKLRLVRKEGRSLADRALFLGWPSSFAVDASRLGIDGGFAYLVHHDGKALPREQVGVFRCSLVDDRGKGELLERLPEGWDGGERFTWLVPQPAIASSSPPSPTRGSSMIRIERHHAPCFRVMVRNLPLTVKSSQLRLFFSKHGRVSEAEVVRYKKTKASQGIAFVTITTLHSNQEDAVDALDGLLLDGISLQVCSVKPKYGQR